MISYSNVQFRRLYEEKQFKKNSQKEKTRRGKVPVGTQCLVDGGKHFQQKNE